VKLRPESGEDKREFEEILKQDWKEFERRFWKKMHSRAIRLPASRNSSTAKRRRKSCAVSVIQVSYDSVRGGRGQLTVKDRYAIHYCVVCAVAGRPTWVGQGREKPRGATPGRVTGSFA
jgi:hypothetical protein